MVPPTDTVALVFTDIESSTSYWEQHGDGFRPVLDLHDTVMRSAITAHGGYEVKTEGDAFMIAFGGPGEALRACLAAQRALQAAEWPAAFRGDDPAFRGPRVRMGVHVGAPICRPDPLTGRMDYFGPVVNRAARIGAAAHGGQVLVSAEALAGAGPVDARLDDLGEHALKGIEGRIRLVAAVPPELPRTFPPPRTVAGRRTNLPAQSTSFVGRHVEVAAVVRALDESRLVTLVGPAGVGKTRLAVHAATDLLASFPGGVWLSPAAGGVSSVAAALGVPLTDRDPDAQLARALAERGRVLLVLDEAETVTVEVGALVARWLGDAPGLEILVTSREALSLPGERIVEVEPLLPDDATALFMARARAVRPDLVVDDTVRRIAHDLDGLPLALELAAARMRSLPPAALLARLDRHLDLLRGPGTGRDTLRGAIDSSWETLDPAERDALCQLSVFRGSFTLEDAEAVVDLGPEAWVVDAVARLHERSLVRVLGHRYALLASIRAYAAEKLVDREAAERRHGTWVTRIPEPGVRHLDDLLAARLRAMGRRDVATAIAATTSAVTVYRMNGPLREVLGLLPDVLALGPDPALRGTLLAQAGGVLVMAGPADARALLDEALSIGQEPSASQARMYLADLERVAGRPARAGELLDQTVGADPITAGRIARRRGLVYAETGRLEAAREAFEAAGSLARQGGDRHGEALALGNLAIVYAETGRPREAIAVLDDAIATHARLGSRVDEAIATQNRANLLIELGRYDEAFAGYEHAIAIHRAVGTRRYEGAALCNLGILQAVRGRFEDARACAAACIPISHEVGDLRFEGIAIGLLADVNASTGALDDADRDARTALEVARRVADRRYELIGLARLGMIAVLRGRLDEAFEVLEPTIMALEAQDDRQNLAVAETDLARVHIARGEYDRAEALLDRAEARLRAGGWRYDLVGTLLARADLDLARGRTPTLDEAQRIAGEIDLSPRTLHGRRLAERAGASCN